MSEILLSLLTGGTAASIVAFLLKSWIEAKITNAIRLEYDKRIELFKRELDQRQKVELVAELLAEWMRTPRGEPVPRDQRTILNRLSFQASLWLPTDLAIELGKRVQNQPDAKSTFEILLFARNVLTGDSTLTPEHVTFWRPELEKQGDSPESEKPLPNEGISKV